MLLFKAGTWQLTQIQCAEMKQLCWYTLFFIESRDSATQTSRGLACQVDFCHYCNCFVCFCFLLFWCEVLLKQKCFFFFFNLKVYKSTHIQMIKSRCWTEEHVKMLPWTLTGVTPCNVMGDCIFPLFLFFFCSVLFCFALSHPHTLVICTSSHCVLNEWITLLFFFPLHFDVLSVWINSNKIKTLTGIPKAGAAGSSCCVTLSEAHQAEEYVPFCHEIWKRTRPSVWFSLIFHVNHTLHVSGTVQIMQSHQ